MFVWREMGDDIHQPIYLYRQLKWYGLVNRGDIFNIVQCGDELKNLDKVVFDTYGEIGRLNSLKMELEKENDKLMKGIDHYGSVMMEKYSETISQNKI